MQMLQEHCKHDYTDYGERASYKRCYSFIRFVLI